MMPEPSHVVTTKRRKLYEGTKTTIPSGTKLTKLRMTCANSAIYQSLYSIAAEITVHLNKLLRGIQRVSTHHVWVTTAVKLVLELAPSRTLLQYNGLKVRRGNNMPTREGGQPSFGKGGK